MYVYIGSATDPSSRSIAVTPLASTPPPYMPDMATTFVSHSGSLGYGGGPDSTKKKRGRPRKYAPDGTVAITIRPAPTPSFNPMMSPLQKRGRGRPPGSGKKQQLAALGTTTTKPSQPCFSPNFVS